MHRFYWVFLLFVVISLRSPAHGVADAVGNTLGWLLISITPTFAWWLISRKKSASWPWFKWLNITACFMAIMISLHTLTNNWAKTKLVENLISTTESAYNSDEKAWTQDSTNSTTVGPWLEYDAPGTRYFRDENDVIIRIYPPGMKPGASPANPVDVVSSSSTIPTSAKDPVGTHYVKSPDGKIHRLAPYTGALEPLPADTPRK